METKEKKNIKEKRIDKYLNFNNEYWQLEVELLFLIIKIPLNLYQDDDVNVLQRKKYCCFN